MLIEEILTGTRREFAVSQEIDPLRQSDALQEVQLLAARVDAISSVAGLLFELRTAMHLAEGNVALLVARGVREFSWSADARSTDRTAWNVVGSEPESVDGLFVFELDLVPNAGLRLVAESAEFYSGNVEGLPEQLPDYVTDDDETIRSNLPGWRSSFSPIWATFIDRVPNQ